MGNVDATIRRLRPSMRKKDPKSYWFSLGFGAFNLVIGIAILNVHIFHTLVLIGFVSLTAWALVFLVHGALMLTAVLSNSWTAARRLNVVGIAIKTAWLAELLTITLTGRSPFLLIVWTLIWFLQIINFNYFGRVGGKDE